MHKLTNRKKNFFANFLIIVTLDIGCNYSRNITLKQKHDFQGNGIPSYGSKGVSEGVMSYMGITEI